MSEPRSLLSRTAAHAVLSFKHSHASLLLESLRPDNTSEIHMELQENRVFIRVASQRLRTLIATCDDLLVNIQVATEALTAVQDSGSETITN